MNEVSDEVLIRRVARSDDRQAFAVLVKRYQSELRGSLRRMCRGDEARADDLAQEAFIRAYRYLRGFKGNSSFRTWLYRIALNNFLNAEKRSLAESEKIRAYADVLPRAEDENLAVQRDVQRALNQLSEPQRLMIDLNLQRGFSHREIVDITGVPLGTVKSHLQRARARLQVLLLDLAET
jgi:RNA polymerase sigma factor (sigma-70 family)